MFRWLKRKFKKTDIQELRNFLLGLREISLRNCGRIDSVTIIVDEPVYNYFVKTFREMLHTTCLNNHILVEDCEDCQQAEVNTFFGITIKKKENDH